MLVLGDVFATVAIVVFSGLAAWAGGLLAAILFPERTERASLDFEQRPWVTFWIGLGMMLVASAIATVIVGIPATRGIGFGLYAAILGVGVFGSGGLFRLIARRVSDHSGAPSSYQALAKAGMLVVAAELLPFFGWFLLLPYVLISSFGAGVMAILRGTQRVTVNGSAEAR